MKIPLKTYVAYWFHSLAENKNKVDSQIKLGIYGNNFQRLAYFLPDNKKYQTSTQLLTKTDLEKEMQNWVKQNIILKGDSGDLIVQILDESVIDSFVEEHQNKFTFLYCPIAPQAKEKIYFL